MCVMCPGCDWPRLFPAEMLPWARHRDGGMCAALPLAKTGMLRGNLCRALIGQDEGIRIIISLLLGLYWMQTGTQHRGGEQRRIRYLLLSRRFLVDCKQLCIVGQNTCCVLLRLDWCHDRGAVLHCRALDTRHCSWFVSPGIFDVPARLYRY